MVGDVEVEDLGEGRLGLIGFRGGSGTGSFHSWRVHLTLISVSVSAVNDSKYEYVFV